MDFGFGANCQNSTTFESKPNDVVEPLMTSPDGIRGQLSKSYLSDVCQHFEQTKSNVILSENL